LIAEKVRQNANKKRKMQILKLTILLIIFCPHANAMSFEDFWQKARETNLDLKIRETESDIAKANAIGINIEPPMVGYMNRSDNSGSADGIEIKQTIPFPTKITNDYLARKYEAKSRDEIRLATEAEIFAKARLVYFNLWKALKLKEILNEKKLVIKKHIKLARAVSRSDSFLKVHLIRTESDLELLENDLIATDQDIKEKTAAMAEFINSDSSEFNPVLKEIPIITITEKPQNPHQLEAKKLTVESRKKRENEADSEWLPDIFLRYRNMGKTQMMPATEETMIGISLPFVFPWEPKAISKKSAATKELAQIEYQKEKIKIETEIKTMMTRLKSLKERLDNVNQKLIPLARKRVSLIQNLAPRDLSTLQEYLETMKNLPELKLEALKVRTEYEQTTAEILKYQKL